MAAAAPVGPGLPSTAMHAPGSRQNIGPLSMGPPQLHHHHAQHAQSDGSPKMEVGVSGSDYPGTQQSLDTRLPTPLIPDIRPAQVFHDTVGPTRQTGPAMPPLMRDSGLSALGRHPTIATSSRMDTGVDGDDEQSPDNEDLFGKLPDGKKRTFILVEDPHRGSRVRVKVMLDKVKMEEIPDSYRKSNAMYPRTYFPVQMKDAPGRALTGRRFFRDDTEQVDDPTDATVGRTTVPAPSLDGERDVVVPKLSRRRHRNEVLMNDLGYRLSWSQSRVFAGRMLFLQRSYVSHWKLWMKYADENVVDAYRNKMRSSMLAAGQDPSDIPEHFDTRRGKRRFLERGGRRLESGAQSAAQRSAEEVEG
ncbi:hypothetical protein N7526_005540 [Penicillium atrosanguineum]|nr:hypothetical protein N7526_005540 [Penicillium atrosanguineum]